MKTSSWVFAAVVLCGALPAFAAEEAPPVAQAPEAVGLRVLVIPFNTLNLPTDQQWIGKGVQETLIADLGRAGGVTPIPFDGQVIVEDNAAAIRLAKAANAAYVIRGAVQVGGTGVRITAQVIDVRTGDSVRTASVIGAVADVLSLQDSLVAQLRGSDTEGTPATTGTAPAPVAGVPAPSTLTIPQPSTPAPAITSLPVSIPPQVDIAQPVYYPAYYPDPGYASYPFGYPYFVTVVTNPRHRHDWDCFDGRDGHGDGHGDRDHHGNGSWHDTRDNPSGVFHIISKPTAAPGARASAMPLPTSNALPLPSSLGLPLPATNALPLAQHSAQPLAASVSQPTPVHIRNAAPSAPVSSLVKSRDDAPRMITVPSAPKVSTPVSVLSAPSTPMSGGGARMPGMGRGSR